MKANQRGKNQSFETLRSATTRRKICERTTFSSLFLYKRFKSSHPGKKKKNSPAGKKIGTHDDIKLRLVEVVNHENQANRYTHSHRALVPFLHCNNIGTRESYILESRRQIFGNVILTHVRRGAEKYSIIRNCALSHKERGLSYFYYFVHIQTRITSPACLTDEIFSWNKISCRPVFFLSVWLSRTKGPHYQFF